MKKLFIVLAVASLGFAACNNEGEKTDAADSTAIKDSIAKAEAAAQAAKDSMEKAAMDTMKAAVDTLKK